MWAVRTMVGYRRLWWVTVLVVCVPALALSALESPVLVLVIGTTALGLRLGLAAMWKGVTAAGRADPVVGGALVLACSPGLQHATGALLLLTCATSAPVVQRLVPGAHLVGEIDVAAARAAEPSSCLHAMTGAELCDLWAWTFLLVRSAPRPSQRAVAAQLRGTILDELERRDAELLAAWLARRPSPASTPVWAATRGEPHRT
jgi:hypothetical protein